MTVIDIEEEIFEREDRRPGHQGEPDVARPGHMPQSRPPVSSLKFAFRKHLGKSDKHCGGHG